MELAKVIGRVVATVKHSSLAGVRLLHIQPQDGNSLTRVRRNAVIRPLFKSQLACTRAW